MSKEYLVTVIEAHRVVYIVPASDKLEARKKIEQFEEPYRVLEDENLYVDSIDDIRMKENEEL